MNIRHCYNFILILLTSLFFVLFFVFAKKMVKEQNLRHVIDYHLIANVKNNTILACTFMKHFPTLFFLLSVYTILQLRNQETDMLLLLAVFTMCKNLIFSFFKTCSSFINTLQKPQHFSGDSIKNGQHSKFLNTV